jgi:hypothetical protein
MSEAQHKAQGIVGISLMVQIGETLTSELRMITSMFNKVTYKGNGAPRRPYSGLIFKCKFYTPTSLARCATDFPFLAT